MTNRADTTPSERLARLYREVILTHAADPVGYGGAPKGARSAVGHNPLCGDRIVLRLAVDGDRISDAAFDGEACAICMASASLLCAHLPGRPAAAIGETLASFHAALAEDDPESTDCPAFMVPMLGVAAYPARVACATLPWETAIEAVNR